MTKHSSLNAADPSGIISALGSIDGKAAPKQFSQTRWGIATLFGSPTPRGRLVAKLACLLAWPCCFGVADQARKTPKCIALRIYVSERPCFLAARQNRAVLFRCMCRPAGNRRRCAAFAKSAPRHTSCVIWKPALARAGTACEVTQTLSSGHRRGTDGFRALRFSPAIRRRYAFMPTENHRAFRWRDSGSP